MGLLGFYVILLFVGITNVLNFAQKLVDSSENVRAVHVIGLIASGVTCGAALAGTIVCLVRQFRKSNRFIHPRAVYPLPILVCFQALLLGGIAAMFVFGQKLVDSSEQVRAVRLIGLTGGAATCGAALVGAIVCLVWRFRPRDEPLAQQSSG
jgi:hypothetical protein